MLKRCPYSPHTLDHAFCHPELSMREHVSFFFFFFLELGSSAEWVWNVLFNCACARLFSDSKMLPMRTRVELLHKVPTLLLFREGVALKIIPLPSLTCHRQEGFQHSSMLCCDCFSFVLTRCQPMTWSPALPHVFKASRQD